MSKYIWWLAVILICIRIFAFSAENAEVSTDTSLEIAEKVVDTLPSTSKLPEPEKEDIAKDINGIIRKLAHGIIYALLGFCMLGAANRTFDKKALLIAVLACFLFACTDEIHQIFVDGRSCELKDVFIDTVGSAVGIIGYILIAKLILLLKLKKDYSR